MKKLLPVLIALVVLLSLIPYNVEAHTSCDIKLIRREKELISLIQSLNIEKAQLQRSSERNLGKYYSMVYAMRAGVYSSPAQMSAAAVGSSARLTTVNRLIAKYTAELKEVQSHLKDNCKRR